MPRILLFLLFILPGLQAHGQQEELLSLTRNLSLMGSNFEITVLAEDESIALINIEEAVDEISRIEALISSWKKDSQTTLINSNAGIQPVVVDKELFELILYCQSLAELTHGAFDITHASMNKVWDFNQSQNYLPAAYEIGEAVSNTGFRKIVLDPDTYSVFLPQPEMKIGFGAIGKGYAADRAKALLKEKGVPAGMINAAGDITTWGTRATGEKWLIGIEDPLANGSLKNWIPLVESSVAITGTQERYLWVNGEKLKDIIDPRNGQPVRGLAKVTVFHKDAAFADALSTALFVLGPLKGLELVNDLPGTEAIFLDEEGRAFYSTGMLSRQQ